MEDFITAVAAEERAVAEARYQELREAMVHVESEAEVSVVTKDLSADDADERR